MLSVNVVLGPVGNVWGIPNRVVTFLTVGGKDSERVVGVASATRVGDSILERVLFIVDGITGSSGAPYPAGDPNDPGRWGSTKSIMLRRDAPGPEDDGAAALRLDAMLRQRLALAKDDSVKVVERAFHWHRTSQSARSSGFPIQLDEPGRRAIYRPPASQPDAVGAAVWYPDGGAGRPTVALLPKAIPDDFLNDWRVREDGENLEKFETWLEREKYTEGAFDVYLCRWAYSQTFDI